MQVVILAAGMGTRLARPIPKPLTPLDDGRTILERQLGHIRSVLPDPQVYVVVGYKLEMILEAHPDVLYVYNECFDRTNTSKSLLRALQLSGPGGVLWLNGDVVFDEAALQRLLPLLSANRSFVVVDTAVVGDEEVKYTIGADGMIDGLSKSVTGARGEAIGINYVSAADKQALVAALDEVGDEDYFERAIEIAGARDGVRFMPVDISDLWAVEVDFEDDLARVNAHLPGRA